MDNNSNWKNALTTNSATNRSNLSHFSTYLWSKFQHSNNSTNEQLANILSHIMNSLNANQISSPNSNSRETKACITDTFSSTKLDKLNDFLISFILLCKLYTI